MHIIVVVLGLHIIADFHSFPWENEGFNKSYIFDQKYLKRTNMKLIEAVRKKDKAAVKKIVDKAVKVYQAAEPEPQIVDTVYGDLDVRMLDKKSKWQVANTALVDIMNAVKCIPEGADRKVETAKIIATSQLRILFDDIDSGNEFL
jgi:hypothetical protein